MLANFDVIPTFSIYGQFMAKTISKLIKNSLNQNKLKNLQPTSYTIALSKGTIFDKRCYFLTKKC